MSPRRYRKSISTRDIPTVIVARTPRSGRERDFERWMRTITDAASQMPGHIGSELQSPGPQHPNEWVIVYQFADQHLLERWIESPRRTSLLQQGEELTEGPARVQRLAMGTGNGPVTAVASFRVLPGQEADFEACYAEMLIVLTDFDGYLRAQLFPPVDGVQDETVIVFSFGSREQLDHWLESPERRDALERLDEHIVGERQVNVIGGFGGWFSLGGQQVKVWKQATIVLLALYPTVLALNEVLGLVLPNLPYLVNVLIGNILGVAILSWILMPRLTALLSDWLNR